MSRITRRAFVRAGIGILSGATAASLLTACGGGPSTAAPPTSPAAGGAPAATPAAAAPGGAATGAGQRVAMLIDTSGAGHAWEGGIKHFNEVNPGKVQATYDTVPYDGLLQKLNLLFFSGSTQYDVVPINGEWTAAVAQYLLPLDDFIGADKLNLEQLFGKDATFTSGGHTLALPGRNGPNIFATRKDLMDQAGLKPPTTIEEWANLGSKLTQRGADGKPTVYGTSFRANAAHWSTVTLAYVYLPYGMRFLTDDLKGPDESLRSDAAVNLLTVMQQMAKANIMPDPVGWSYTDNITAWQQGTMASSDFFAARSQAIEDKSKSTVTGKVQYSLGPGKPAAPGASGPFGPHKPVYFAGPWYIGINAKTQNRQAAWALVKFLTASEDGQKYMALQAQNQPTLLSVLSSDEYRRQDPAADVSLQVYRDVGWSTVAPVPQNADIELAIHTEVQALFGGKAPHDVAQAVYDGIGKVLKG